MAYFWSVSTSLEVASLAVRFPVAGKCSLAQELLFCANVRSPARTIVLRLRVGEPLLQLFDVRLVLLKCTPKIEQRLGQLDYGFPHEEMLHRG